MKKGIKFSLCVLGTGIGFCLAGLSVVGVLQHYGLMFRAWIRTSFFAILALLGLALSCGIIYTLANLFSHPQKQRKKRIAQKILSASGSIAVLLCTGALEIVSIFGWTFAYEPEYLVNKNGQKMVAYVNSFVEVYVDYHEYKNFLVCGYNVIGEEWYGSGGYDPFTLDPVPEPKTSEFYDKKQN